MSITRAQIRTTVARLGRYVGGDPPEVTEGANVMIIKMTTPLMGRIEACSDPAALKRLYREELNLSPGDPDGRLIETLLHEIGFGSDFRRRSQFNLLEFILVNSLDSDNDRGVRTIGTRNICSAIEESTELSALFGNLIGFIVGDSTSSERGEGLTREYIAGILVQKFPSATVEDDLVEGLIGLFTTLHTKLLSFDDVMFDHLMDSLQVGQCEGGRRMQMELKVMALFCNSLSDVAPGDELTYLDLVKFINKNRYFPTLRLFLL